MHKTRQCQGRRAQKRCAWILVYVILQEYGTELKFTWICSLSGTKIRSYLKITHRYVEIHMIVLFLQTKVTSEHHLFQFACWYFMAPESTVSLLPLCYLQQDEHTILQRILLLYMKHNRLLYSSFSKYKMHTK